MDISFLYTYKGVLYPVEDATSNHDSGSVASLLDLVCRKLVQDASTTERALECVPSDVCYDLMRAALRDTRDRAIEVLISRWPGPVLQLSRFAPPLFEELGALYNDRYLGEQMRRGVKYTTCLAHTFVECLKKRAPTRLRCLDLSGYPAAEVIVNYLSSHVLLVYNEVRQREIISMYNEVTGRLPKEQRHTYLVENTLPDNNTYVIVVDAFLFSNDTHMELCRALKTSRATLPLATPRNTGASTKSSDVDTKGSGTSTSGSAIGTTSSGIGTSGSAIGTTSSDMGSKGSVICSGIRSVDTKPSVSEIKCPVPLRLRLAKLDLSCFGVARISVLLEQIDAQFLKALCLQYNSVGEEGLLILCPALQRLTSLTALDISCNNITLTRPDSAAILRQTLQSLPRLVRLDLSNNRTKQWLHAILPDDEDDHHRSPLQYLRLCGCGLTVSDLTFLKNSPHAKELRHLDLSENTLSEERLPAFLNLLRAVSGQLTVLEVENCGMEQQDLADFFQTCRVLQSLRFLNLSRNDNLGSNLILSHLETFSDMQKLEVLRMSFPRECYELPENEEAIEAFKVTLSHRFTALLHSVCDKKKRKCITFVLTQSSFDLS